MRKARASFTLAEILIAFMVLIVGLTGILHLYINSSALIARSDHNIIATRELTSVMEHIKSLSLSQIKSQKDVSDYWNGILSGQLTDAAVSVVNKDSGDTDWNNDPLELKVTLSWMEKGAMIDLSMESLFSDS